MFQIKNTLLLLLQKLEEMYEVPLFPAAPSQPLPTIPSSLTAGAEEDTLYDVIPGDV